MKGRLSLLLLFSTFIFLVLSSIFPMLARAEDGFVITQNVTFGKGQLSPQELTILTYDIKNSSEVPIIANRYDDTILIAEYVWKKDSFEEVTDMEVFEVDVGAGETYSEYHTVVKAPSESGIYSLFLQIKENQDVIFENIELADSVLVSAPVNQSEAGNGVESISAPCQLVHDASIVNENRKHWEFLNYHNTSVDLFANSTRGYVDPDGFLSCIGDRAYAPVSGKAVATKKLLDASICPGIQPEKIVLGNLFYDHYVFIDGDAGVDTLLVHIDADHADTIRDGSIVSTGEFVGRINDAGCAFGKHIHFTVKKNGIDLPYSNWEFRNFNPSIVELNNPIEGSSVSALENIQLSWSPHRSVNNYFVVLNGDYSNAISVGNTTKASISPSDSRLREGFNTWQILTDSQTELGDQIQSKIQRFELGVADTKLVSPVGGSVFIPKTKQENISFVFSTNASHLYEFRVLADGETIFFEERFPVNGSLSNSSERYITLPKSWFSGYSEVTWQVRPRATIGTNEVYGDWQEGSFKLAYPLSAPTPEIKSNGAMPVFRFYNAAVNSHIYTISTYERDTILDGSPSNNWYYEGVGFYAYPLENGSCDSGQSTIYRFRNKTTGRYLYSTNGSEVSSLNWYHEGAHYCAWRNAVAGSIPAYRLYNANENRHFITLSSNEKNSLLKSGWYLDGLLFYAEGAIDKENSNAVSVYRFYNSKMKTDRLVADQTLADNLASSVQEGWEFKETLFVTSKYNGSCANGVPVHEFFHKPSNTFHYTLELEYEQSSDWSYKGASFCAEEEYRNGLMPVFESKYAVSSRTIAYQTRYLTSREKVISLNDPWELSEIPFYVGAYKVNNDSIKVSDLHLEHKVNLSKLVGGLNSTHIIRLTNTGSEVAEDIVFEIERSGVLSLHSNSPSVECSQSSTKISCNLNDIQGFDETTFNIVTSIASVNRNVRVPISVQYKDESIQSNNFDSQLFEVRTPISVVRYYNPGSRSHIWSMHSAERRNLDRSSSWIREGTAFRAYSPTSGGTCPAGSTRVFRLRNASKPFYLYTQSTSYYNSLGGSRYWNKEGLAFCAPTSSILGRKPIYRLYNSRNGNHLFTISARERDHLRNAGWYYEGVHFYAF